jgi:hypothetical protein
MIAYLSFAAKTLRRHEKEPIPLVIKCFFGHSGWRLVYREAKISHGVALLSHLSTSAKPRVRPSEPPVLQAKIPAPISSALLYAGALIPI